MEGVGQGHNGQVLAFQKGAYGEDGPLDEQGGSHNASSWQSELGNNAPTAVVSLHGVICDEAGPVEARQVLGLGELLLGLQRGGLDLLVQVGPLCAGYHVMLGLYGEGGG